MVKLHLVLLLLALATLSAHAEIEDVAQHTEPLPLFDCNGRKYCRDMVSCEEAEYRFHVCGEKQLDRDKDGIPCENICGGKRK